jgi:hypothetical protein
MMQDKCLICDVVITDTNDSEEHIILQAIGGRLSVSGFICRNDNNKTGTEWDAVLAEALNPFSLLLSIKRQDGKKPGTELFDTLSGQKMLIRSDRSMAYQKPEINIVKEGDIKKLSIRANSVAEARQILTGMKRKYPKIDVEKALSEMQNTRIYSNDPIKKSLSIGGPAAGRSMIKSLLAFAHKLSIDARDCPLAFDYIRNEEAKSCYGYYYQSDLINNRPEQNIFHCVGISGSKSTGLLLGYLEYFSGWRVVSCLSENYTGPDIHEMHAIDPVRGKTIDLQFSLPFSKSDLEAIYDYKKIPDGAMEEALGLPMSMIVETGREVAFEEATNYAYDQALKTAGLKPGDELSPEKKWELSRLIAENFMPFVKANYTFTNRRR